MWIPKAGDKARVNPEFVKYAVTEKHAACFGWVMSLDNISKSGALMLIERVADHGISSSFVMLSFGSPINQDFDVWKDTGAFFAYECNTPPILLPAEQVSIPVFNLKDMNTKPGATICASCGEKLKNPMPGSFRFQHCPKCEP